MNEPLLAIVLIVASVLAIALLYARSKPDAMPVREVNLEPEVECGPYPRMPDSVPGPPDWLLAERDPPYDLRSFFAPILPEENAAPLYLEVFAEFGNDAVNCLHPSRRADPEPQVAGWFPA